MATEDKLREYLKRATVDLTEARRRIGELEEERHEPIAIIGMSCRYPGAPTVEDYWSLLSEGRNGVVEVPPTRWDIDDYYDPRPPGERRRLHPARRLPARHRRLGRGVLRLPAGRGAADGSAAAAADGAGLRGPGQRRHAGAAAGRQPDRRAGRADGHRPVRPAAGRAVRHRRARRPVLRPGRHRQRGGRPAGLPVRPARAGGHPGHRVLVLAGRACTWPPRRCAAASATWRWPPGRS